MAASVSALSSTRDKKRANPAGRVEAPGPAAPSRGTSSHLLHSVLPADPASIPNDASLSHLTSSSALGKHPAGLMPRSSATPLPWPVQAKLQVGTADDPLEHEADHVADRVMRMPNPALRSLAAESRGEPQHPAPYEEQQGDVASTLSRKESGGLAAAEQGAAPPLLDEVLRSPGQPLDAPTRSFMESRFGQDFSRVKVHADAKAADSARAIHARAYTARHDIVFGTAEYAPSTQRGRRLLAHELAHSVQQGESSLIVRRQSLAGPYTGYNSWPPSPHPPAPVPATDVLKADIRATAAYKALTAESKKLAEEIITEVDKRAPGERLKLLTSLKALFDTPVKPPATVSAETKADTATAATKEKTRLSKPAEAKATTIEEEGTRSAKRVWTPIKGKFGGGTYYVDKKSPTDIHIKAKIYLHPTGTGTLDDVNKIKGMEDAIEKAASTKGYMVDIIFVAAKDADTFDVEVDPSRWEVATNWSGGDPVGFAHELHHMFAFELDKYNYIDSHSTNQSMEVDQRLIWFRKEVDKPPNYNDPTSIMNAAAHPNDRDVCATAGLDMKTCLAARSATP